MYLKFMSLDIEGFQSIDKAYVSFDSQGVILVRGVNMYDSNASSNGSGKSSIFEALMWSIYGRTSSGISDPVNRYYDGGCVVDLKFMIDSNEYRIVRSYKHQRYKSSVKLFRGDEEISARNKTDTDKIIRSDIMPISQDIFLSTVFLSQGFSGRLSILSPSGRKERIEILTDTSSKVDEFRDKVTAIKNRYSGEYDSVSQSIMFTKGKISSTDRQISDLRAQIDESEKQRPEGNIDDISSKIKILESDSSNLQTEYDDARDRLHKYESDLSDCRHRADTISKEIDSINREIRDIKSGKPCPTCGRPTNEKPIDRLVITSKYDKIKSNNKEMSDISASEEDLKSKISELKKMIDDMYGRQVFISGKLHKLRELLFELSKFRDMTPEKSKIDELMMSVDSMNKDILDMNKNLSSIESKRDVANHCISLISKQFRGYLLQEIIEFMNSRLSIYSRMLFSNLSDKISLVVDSSKLDIYLGDAIYDTLSGGERKKVDIALVLTQRDLAMNISGLSCNLLILDEIIENCDQTATNSVLTMLSEASSDIESMFIISHNNYSIPYDSILTVTKKSNRLSSISFS